MRLSCRHTPDFAAATACLLAGLSRRPHPDWLRLVVRVDEAPLTVAYRVRERIRPRIVAL
ncbi:MAG: hypothetical protein JXC32_04805 [Anaerolineae bacterium]|nr:hypothetical protein [Anaerolineae bacterium]